MSPKEQKKISIARQMAKLGLPIDEPELRQEMAVILNKDLLEKLKNKLTIVENGPFSIEQQILMHASTPAKYVKERPGKGGGKWKYVSGHFIKKRLNYVFGWAWSFQVLNQTIDDRAKQAYVLGRLTILNPKTCTPMVIKEQFGRADIKFWKTRPDQPLDLGNDLKAAATDALKRCAFDLGMAADISGYNEHKEMGIEAKGPAPAALPPATQPAAAPAERLAECVSCGNELLPAERDYSKKVYGKALCRVCQKDHNTK